MATIELKSRQVRVHTCVCVCVARRHASVCSGPILSHGILCDAQKFSGNELNPVIISFHLVCTQMTSADMFHMSTHFINKDVLFVLVQRFYLKVIEAAALGRSFFLKPKK